MADEEKIVMGPATFWMEGGVAPVADILALRSLLIPQKFARPGHMPGYRTPEGPIMVGMPGHTFVQCVYRRRTATQRRAHEDGIAPTGKIDRYRVPPGPNLDREEKGE